MRYYLFHANLLARAVNVFALEGDPALRSVIGTVSTRWEHRNK